MSSSWAADSPGGEEVGVLRLSEQPWETGSHFLVHLLLMKRLLGLPVAQSSGHGGHNHILPYGLIRLSRAFHWSTHSWGWGSLWYKLTALLLWIAMQGTSRSWHTPARLVPAALGWCAAPGSTPPSPPSSVLKNKDQELPFLFLLPYFTVILMRQKWFKYQGLGEKRWWAKKREASQFIFDDIIPSPLTFSSRLRKAAKPSLITTSRLCHCWKPPELDPWELP